MYVRTTVRSESPVTSNEPSDILILFICVYYILCIIMILLLCAITCFTKIHAFQVGYFALRGRTSWNRSPTVGNCKNDKDELGPPFFDEFDDADGVGFVTQSSRNSIIVTDKEEMDLSGVRYRQFKLGLDVELTDFVGSLGFDEIVDWEYYDDKKVEVEPFPLDPTQPKRTRSSSGSLIRLYLGKLTGELGASLRSRGMDSRVLIKEFVGDIAANLASTELESISKLQTALILRVSDSENDTFCFANEISSSWASTAKYRNSAVKNAKQSDNISVIQLVQLLQREKVPFVYIIGNMVMDPDGGSNEKMQQWYSTFGVAPPKASSVWVLYEYAGLRHTGLYAQPADIIKAIKRPLVKQVFGLPLFSAPISVIPSWQERANYVVNGILKKTLEAVAYLHENGIVHRSIGQSSVILSSVGMDKSETALLEATSVERLVIKLADFGFSTTIASATEKPSSSRNPRLTGSLSLNGAMASTANNPFFAVAEDLHALGLVFLGILLSSLADFSDVKTTSRVTLPPIDEDRLQRLLTEIFKKDIKEFREYCLAEEAWTKVVQFLDDHDGAGWELLQSLCFARERTVTNLKTDKQLLTARGLLSSRFFISNRKA